MPKFKGVSMEACLYINNKQIENGIVNRYM